MTTSVYINSSDRYSGTADDYHVNIGPSLSDPSKYSKLIVSDCMLRNTLYNINSNNNKLWFNYRTYIVADQTTKDYPFPLTISPGTYTEATLSAAITGTTVLAAMIATYSWLSDAPTPTVSVTYNQSTLKFTVTISTGYNGTSASLVTVTGTPPAEQPQSNYYRYLSLCDTTISGFTFATSLNSTMGYDSFVWSFPSYTTMSGAIVVTTAQTGGNACDITEYYRFIYLCCDFLNTDNMTSSESNTTAIKSVIGKIPLTSFGTTTFWEAPTYPVTSVNFQSIINNYKRLHIYFRDQYLNPISFNGSDHQITLKLLE